jgi:peptide subunit release factor 1 (eRF1)
MKVEVAMSRVYNDSYLLNYFFRNQAKETFKELFDSVQEDSSAVLNAIENYSDDLEEVEELFYNESIEELCEIFGLTLGAN